MCTVNVSEPRATICDVAIPFVRSALQTDEDLAVEFAPSPGEGTEVRLRTGDPHSFDQLVRDAIARANE